MHDFRATVHADPWEDKISLFLAATDDDGRPIHFIADQGQLVACPHRQNERMDPMFTVQGSYGNVLMSGALPAIYRALAVHLGEPTNDRLAGRLEAVEQHLEDMRVIAATKLNVPLNYTTLQVTPR